MLRVELDGRFVGNGLNHVTVIFELPDGTERRVNVTHEGIIVDLVSKDGEVLDTRSMEHEDVFSEVEAIEEEEDV
jgi:cytochrome c-type biogenesis protein CcmE